MEMSRQIISCARQFRNNRYPSIGGRVFFNNIHLVFERVSRDEYTVTRTIGDDVHPTIDTHSKFKICTTHEICEYQPCGCGATFVTPSNDGQS